MDILKRVFGLARPNATCPESAKQLVTMEPAAGSEDGDTSTLYYASMSRMQTAMSRRDYDSAAAETRASLRLIPSWVRATREDFGSFDISSIPAIEQGAVALAMLGDEEGLAEMAAVVARTPELRPWGERVSQAQEDRRYFLSILELVAKNPGCLQTDLKTQIAGSEGSRLALLASYLEKAGRLARVKSGKSYALFPPGSPQVPLPPPKRTPGSHRSDRSPPRLTRIDVSKLDYVPLPRSPLRWEEAQAGRERKAILAAEEAFEVRDAAWTVGSVDAIPPAERPDTAYRMARPNGSGVILLDDSGRAQGLGPIPASALRYDDGGRVAAQAALPHDVYRSGVHPMGHGFIALSREAVLHAYDDDLRPTIETALRSAPEVMEIRERFEISDEELKNHIRCVALSRDGSRYLFTIVDEAWCVTADGTGLWGARLPIKDGWRDASNTRGAIGTSEEVARALALMDLQLPITPDELKARYRALAKKWHPDLNPADAAASDKMKALSAAAEVLTGIEAADLPEFAGAVFSREIIAARVRGLTVTMGIQVGEKFAADWIYAASFAANSDGAYLAGYSGRVVEVDAKGRGVRVYDIGAVPRQIVDIGEYLYLLTDTRLYVLRGSTLHALIDTFDGGELFVADAGFGLLEQRRLRWFSRDGTYAGSVVTKDPIRRLYFRDGHLVVETRQKRAVIKGLSPRG